MGDGRAPSGQALVSDGAGQAVSTLTGFDPSRERARVIDGIAYITPLLESEIGYSKRLFGRIAFVFFMRPDCLGIGIQFLRGGMAVQLGPTMFAVVHIDKYLGWSDAAIATEARRAGTVEQGPVHEGADPKGIAQKDPSHD